MFEPSLRDERVLPFEGSGAISEWQLELPVAVPQFDYDTIADVILHVRYTAREGGGLLRGAAADDLVRQLDGATAAGSVRLFSLRHEFPTEWARFKAATVGGSTPTAELAFTLRPEHYPFWSRGRLKAAARVELFSSADADPFQATANADGTGAADDVAADAALGVLSGRLTTVPLPADPGDATIKAPTGDFRLRLTDNSMRDLWLAVTWGKAIEEE
jgi:hypothetical protein